jgi:hypothetical protein
MLPHLVWLINPDKRQICTCHLCVQMAVKSQRMQTPTTGNTMVRPMYPSGQQYYARPHDGVQGVKMDMYGRAPEYLNDSQASILSPTLNNFPLPQAPVPHSRGVPFGIPNQFPSPGMHINSPQVTSIQIKAVDNSQSSITHMSQQLPKQNSTPKALNNTNKPTDTPEDTKAKAKHELLKLENDGTESVS